MKEFVVAAGANGSGKTTFAKQLVSETGYAFLNADEIEKTLEPAETASTKVMAGRLFFQHLNELINAGQSFILESTLSGKYLLKVIESAQQQGYVFKLFYVFLDSPAVCIERIKNRVKLGGHFVPDVDVRRRYYRSKQNFWHMYKNLADEWIVFHNPTPGSNLPIVAGFQDKYLIEDELLFLQFINDDLDGSKAV